MTLVVLITTIASVIGATVHNVDLPMRIVGGYETTIENHPHQLLIVLKAHTDEPLCGASLLSSNIAITAAHCFNRLSPQLITVRAGVTSLSKDKGSFSLVKTIMVHPKWNPHKMPDNDIALFRLATPLTISKRIKPILLADSRLKLTGSEYVTGWGNVNRKIGATRFSDVLKQARVSFAKKCVLPFSTMICAKVSMSKEWDDSCQGDSGGPVVSNGKLVGIVSRGVAINNTFKEGCGLPGIEAYYTDVRLFRNWIKEKVGL